MVNVTVTAKGSDGPVDWEIDGKKAANSTIEFKPKTGPQVIHFMLDDQTGRDLRFDQSEFFLGRQEPCRGLSVGGRLLRPDDGAVVQRQAARRSQRE